MSICSWLGCARRIASHERSGIVSVLDIGSTKIVCMIARLTPRDESQMLPGRTHGSQVIGIGHQRSRGIKSGVIVDLDARRAGDPPRGRRRRAHGRAHRRIADRQRLRPAACAATPTRRRSISAARRSRQADIGRVLAAGASSRCSQDRAVLHSLPIGFSLDGERGVARSARHDRRHARRRHARRHRRRAAAAQPRALHQPLPSLGRAHGRDALCQRPRGAGRRRSRARRAPASTWAAARRRSRSSPTASSSMPTRSRRRPSRHHRHRPRPLDPARAMPSG